MNKNEKAILDSTVSELIDKKKNHEYYIDMIDKELLKRRSDQNTTKKLTVKSDTAKPKAKPKAQPKVEEKLTTIKKKKIDATKEDMKAVLIKKDISFKANSTREELVELVKKNNLVRVAENHHKAKKQ